MKRLLILTILLREQARMLLLPPALTGGLNLLLGRAAGSVAGNVPADALVTPEPEDATDK